MKRPTTTPTADSIELIENDPNRGVMIIIHVVSTMLQSATLQDGKAELTCSLNGDIVVTIDGKKIEGFWDIKTLDNRGSDANSPMHDCGHTFDEIDTPLARGTHKLTFDMS